MFILKMLVTLSITGLFYAYGAVAAMTGETTTSTASTTIEQGALDLLAGMSDYLARANSMILTARLLVEAPINGQQLHFWSKSEVTLRRPDSLRILTQSDSRPNNVYYDGKTLSVFAPMDNMYAEIAAPATLDELFPFAVENAGIHTTYTDLLTSDPFASLTEGLTSAFQAGQSTIDGTLCNHLAFRGEAINWEIWIATGEKPLPLMMIIRYVDLPDQPRFILHYSNWQLNASVEKDAFVFVKPADAVKISFQPEQVAALTEGGGKNE